MANPALSDKAFERMVTAEQRAGWAAGTGTPTRDAGPLTPAPYDTMTVNGSITATAVLLVLLCITGAIGWNLVEAIPLGNGQSAADVPGWIFAPLLGAIGLAIATIFRPQWARFTAPLYALVEGLVVGAISKVYETYFDGIVLNAVMATVAVLGVMLFLHATRIIKVTERFRTVVMCATGAIALVYLVNIVLRLFGSEVPFLHDTGTIGILVSVAIVVVAALNLSLDFDFIERGVKAGAPKTTEWYAAFGLLITLVWLYLELLRLLSKLQSRN
ncbi:MAG: Bax inhibitor-1/YccA family protein [Acidimicrobiia bacterium]|nr:Bax inhibitor-1/YccA family protein [Acidimicrobiia bacterium]